MGDVMQAPFADPFLELEPRKHILPLAGRALERQMICSLLETVAQDSSGSARALVISGEIGVGKSRLLADMYQEARARNFLVLETRTYEMGSMFPYLPFIEALRVVIRSSAPQQLRQYTGLVLHEGNLIASTMHDAISLTGLPLVTALSQLFPELPLKLGLAITPAQERLSPDQEKFRLFDSIATLLERIAQEQPVLLSIDNLHWADSASMELMLYLTVRLHKSCVALAGATRPAYFARSSENSTPTSTANAAKILRELMLQGLLLLLPLAPLDEAASLQHLHELLPGTLSTDITQTLLERAEGNPYFLEELVRVLTLRGQLIQRDGVWTSTSTLSNGMLPESITLAVEQRLQGLACRELLQIASLFGRTFPLQPLATVFGQELEQTQHLLDEAIQQRIIARTPHSALTSSGSAENVIALLDAEPTFIFCQNIVHEAILAEASPPRARQLHGAIGAALEAYYGSTAPTQAAELARHYVLGNKKEQALLWSLRAGEEATRQQAHREAIDHVCVAIKLLEANVQIEHPQETPLLTQLYTSLGESWFKLGELDQAADAFRQALEHGRATSTDQTAATPLLLARANRLSADIHRMQGNYELALAHLQAASNLLDKGNTSRTFAQTAEAPQSDTFWLSAGNTYSHLAQVTERREEIAPVSLTELNATERLLLLHARATLDVLLFRPGEAAAALWQAYQLATELGDRGGQAFALHILGWISGWGERIAEAIRLISQARDLYLASGDPFHVVLEDQSLGIIYQAIGEMERARFYNLHGFEQARRYGVQHILAWLHCNQGVMALAQGDWEEADQHLRLALQDAEERNTVRLKPFALQAQAMLHFRRGSWHEAEQAFQAALQVATSTEWYPGTLALYGHFLAVTGRTRAALAQLNKAAAQPEPFGYAGHFYIPFLAEGYLHLQQHKRAATYIESIRNLRGFLYYGFSVDRILGEVAAQQGDWAEAEGAFEDGLALCRRSHNAPEEATILYEQARTALMHSREEPDASSRSALQDIHALCNRARALFVQYEMQRAADLVDVLQEGVYLLEKREQTREHAQPDTPAHLAHAGYQLDQHLTRRELEVLRLVAEGHTDREVAETLVVSPRTINRHLSNIFTKLDVPGRAAAVAYAIRQGLVK
ncbi:MAG TPA: AAA family ATPase [Ktedonobacteraceae bacterium]|nr:AAA family ATPase [Ktedonobacteraceae bacterium]